MNHQRLNCYNLLVDVAKKVPDLLIMLPRGEYYIIDQLKRALSSAILNLSEGNARISSREKKRFFDISLASIAESASAIDIISAYGHIPKEMADSIKQQLRSSYAMLKNLQKRS